MHSFSTIAHLLHRNSLVTLMAAKAILQGTGRLDSRMLA
jgi:hypothetical protein